MCLLAVKYVGMCEEGEEETQRITTTTTRKQTYDACDLFITEF